MDRTETKPTAEEIARASVENEGALAAEPGRQPSPRYAVGDHVRHDQLGVDRVVHGVRTTPEGQFLQFGPEGAWLPAVGFIFAPPPEVDPPIEE